MRLTAMLGTVLVVALGVQLGSCSEGHAEQGARQSLEDEFTKTLETHLRAISEKDIETLKSTLVPGDEFFLILPGSKTVTKRSEFLQSHVDWFQDPTWTYEYRITHSIIGDRVGIAIVDVMYREPERDGKPYFNHMTLSYGLQRMSGKWFVIKDHASTIEKTQG